MHPHFASLLQSVSPKKKTMLLSPSLVRSRSPQQHTCPARPSLAWRRRTRPHPVLLCALLHATIHLTHHGRGGRGGLRLHLHMRPHPPRSSAGRGGLRLRLGVHWAIDIPLTRACWLPEFNTM
jgi:hypothetical protein